MTSYNRIFQNRSGLPFSAGDVGFYLRDSVIKVEMAAFNTDFRGSRRLIEWIKRLVDSSGGKKYYH
ncbi:hypothetical protein [Paenibacillus sp. 481]|uniref:hypothetical protein n=1 Tax=Paenibacillus sp. 481 TaxID=2835869 RepID=UPI001E59BC57|nr:hypothetical protein [Paenibacillus sp. 481]UHA72707.1 hypothetical protein KIK04_19015 [Paenibacillus sp. 481]